MIYENYMVFYHAAFQEGLTEIKPSKQVSNNHNGKVSADSYGCLATSPAQAMYWVNQLRGERKKAFIYEVRLEFGDIVEECKNGYHFEGRGKLVPAIEVGEHAIMDGEINIFSPVPVLGVLCEINFTSKLLS